MILFLKLPWDFINGFWTPRTLYLILQKTPIVRDVRFFWSNNAFALKVLQNIPTWEVAKRGVINAFAPISYCKILYGNKMVYQKTTLFARWGALPAFAHAKREISIFSVYILFVLPRITLQGNKQTKVPAISNCNKIYFFRCDFMKKRKKEFDEFVETTCKDQAVGQVSDLKQDEIFLPNSALPADLPRMKE